MHERRLGLSALLSGVCVASLHGSASAGPQVGDAAAELLFPGQLEDRARVAGNPLATYTAMLALDARYRASKKLGAIYPEVRCNYEEFLGFPLAGVEAMSLPALRMDPSSEQTPIPPEYEPRAAVDVIVDMAKTTRLVIYGEEHHLPQTRSIYEPLLRELWRLGYRYLAAETFADEVMAPDFTYPSYHSGYYLMDPVYSAAVRTARRLGYRLIAYDTTERGPPGDGSFRDRTEAENIKKRVFDGDPEARVLVIAGRGHAAEVPPADGWTPMASVLKKLTGIDPFTIFAPTMGQRMTPSEEDPRYRFATARDLVHGPTIFVRKNGACLGSGNCDAYVFWPRFVVEQGRPDWMTLTLGRRRIAIPDRFAEGGGARLVQAFVAGEPVTAIPADQVVLTDEKEKKVLMLGAGDYSLRTIDRLGTVLAAGPLKVTE
jgi:hypothetical protein